MVDLVKKKLGKLVGLKKEAFNELIKAKEISVVRPRLLPVYKLGDEMALTSVLLSALRLVKEFREQFLRTAKMSKGTKVYFYSEVVFSTFPESRIDGLIIVVKAGVIKDAAILEVKNGRAKLEKTQLERYQTLARTLSIPNFITVSNEFVTEPTQSPVPLKQYKAVDQYHYSWTYLLTVAHVLLYKNMNNIEDEDQVEIMKEVVRYFESEKTGVIGYGRMSPEWTQTIEKIKDGALIRASDETVTGAVRSWQQQEKDMALALSRAIGFIVECGEARYKGNMPLRLEEDCKKLVADEHLTSVFKIKGAAADIGIKSLFDKRAVELSITLKAPESKTAKGQVGWSKKQIETCLKKHPQIIESFKKEIFIEPCVKGARINERFVLEDFDKISAALPTKQFKEFTILQVKYFGAKFSSPTKFVEVSELMLQDFYTGVVQNLTKWEPQAPKMKPKECALEEEAFIEDVNKGLYIKDSVPPALPISIKIFAGLASPSSSDT